MPKNVVITHKGKKNEEKTERLSNMASERDAPLTFRISQAFPYVRVAKCPLKQNHNRI